jgi:hypothetical protein
MVLSPKHEVLSVEEIVPSSPPPPKIPKKQVRNIQLETASMDSQENLRDADASMFYLTSI